MRLGHEAVDLASTVASTVASTQVRRGSADLVREIETIGHPAADLREHAAPLLCRPPGPVGA